VPDSSELAGWNVLAVILGEAQKQQDSSIGHELDGLTIRRVLSIRW